ncbi:hypothetical protein LUU34_01436100 [Aix galericulata]|nr:hypothetical protein LUU34_01436100 [Aix galericulata]
MVQQQLAELKVCRAAGCLPGLGSGVGSRGQAGTRGISWLWDEGAVCWTEPVPPAPARGLQRVARTCPGCPNPSCTRCPEQAGLLALHEEELWAQVPVPSCARLCQAVPGCATPFQTVLCHGILYHSVPYSAVPCHAVPYKAFPCCTVPLGCANHAMPCCAVPCLVAPQVHGSMSEGQGLCATTHI